MIDGKSEANSEKTGRELEIFCAVCFSVCTALNNVYRVRQKTEKLKTFASISHLKSPHGRRKIRTLIAILT